MKIYFGKAIDSNTENYYEFKGEHYSYVIDADSESVTIKDTCGRYLPLDITEVTEAITALIAYMEELGQYQLIIQNIEDNNTSITVN